MTMRCKVEGIVLDISGIPLQLFNIATFDVSLHGYVATTVVSSLLVIPPFLWLAEETISLVTNA